MSLSKSINFSIRPNKSVEIKIVFNLLLEIDQILNFKDYQYIGFGSLWFSDLIMAHKMLSISDMKSIESDPYLSSRADFNKPYSCVKIYPGESNSILPTLPIGENNLLAWLDYTSSLDKSILEDLTTLCRKANIGSIILTTINVHKGSLPNKDEAGREFMTDQEKLKFVAGDLIPAELPSNIMQKSKYPPYIADRLFEHLRRQVRKSGREDVTVLPIFNIGYNDDAPMLTIGAILVDQELEKKIKQRLLDCKLSAFLDEKRHLQIGVPALTLKEKATLEPLFPNEFTPREEDILRLGFKLKPSEIEAYHKFYKYYPTFWEFNS